jgi:hypothetical protein
MLLPAIIDTTKQIGYTHGWGTLRYTLIWLPEAYLKYHFCNMQLFCENLAVIIRNKVVETVQSRNCKVSLTQNVHSGIVIEVASVFGQADPQ